jgi:phosphatidylglycerophosphate synthase
MTRSDRVSREDYLARWSALHEGIDPRGNRLVLVWLTAMYQLARPLAGMGVSPSMVTVLGLLVTAAAVPLAALGGGWTALAGAVVLLAGTLDGLDGAVAVLSGRVTTWGAVLDSVADRASEALALVALALVGAPLWLCALGGALVWLLEYTRARAEVSGVDASGVLTPGERPTRVLLAGMSMVAAAIYPDAASTWATAGAAATAAVGAVSLLLLLAVAYQRSR